MRGMDHAEHLKTANQAIIDATRARAHAIRAARDDGWTWRAIALALGMTERGVVSIIQRENARKVAEEE